MELSRRSSIILNDNSMGSVPKQATPLEHGLASSETNTPPPLDTTESWSNQLAGVGILGNKWRGMDLQDLSFQQGKLAQITL
ncbi:hypothetical protein F7725_025167, partial [Dissostichus mawsoni]